MDTSGGRGGGTVCHICLNHNIGFLLSNRFVSNYSSYFIKHIHVGLILNNFKTECQFLLPKIIIIHLNHRFNLLVVQVDLHEYKMRFFSSSV